MDNQVNNNLSQAQIEKQEKINSYLKYLQNSLDGDFEMRSGEVSLFDANNDKKLSNTEITSLASELTNIRDNIQTYFNDNGEVIADLNIPVANSIEQLEALEHVLNGRDSNLELGVISQSEAGGLVSSPLANNIQTEGGFIISTSDDGNNIKIYQPNGEIMTQIFAGMEIDEYDQYGSRSGNWYFGNNSSFILEDGTKIKLDLYPEDGGAPTMLVDNGTGQFLQNFGKGTVTNVTGNPDYIDANVSDATLESDTEYQYNNSGTFAWSNAANNQRGGWTLVMEDGSYRDIKTETWGEYVDENYATFEKQLADEVLVSREARMASLDGEDAGLRDRLRNAGVDHSTMDSFMTLLTDGYSESILNSFVALVEDNSNTLAAKNLEKAVASILDKAESKAEQEAALNSVMSVLAYGYDEDIIGNARFANYAANNSTSQIIEYIDRAKALSEPNLYQINQETGAVVASDTATSHSNLNSFYSTTVVGGETLVTTASASMPAEEMVQGLPQSDRTGKSFNMLLDLMEQYDIEEGGYEQLPTHLRKNIDSYILAARDANVTENQLEGMHNVLSSNANNLDDLSRASLYKLVTEGGTDSALQKFNNTLSSLIDGGQSVGVSALVMDLYTIMLLEGTTKVLEEFETLKTELLRGSEQAITKMAGLATIATYNNDDDLIAQTRSTEMQVLNKAQVNFMGINLPPDQDSDSVDILKTAGGHIILTGGTEEGEGRYGRITMFGPDGQRLARFDGDPHVYEQGNGGTGWDWHFGDDSTFIFSETVNGEETAFKLRVNSEKIGTSETGVNLYGARGLIVDDGNQIFATGNDGVVDENKSNFAEVTNNSWYSDAVVDDAGADTEGALVAYWHAEANDGIGGFAILGENGQFFDINNEAWTNEAGTGYKDSPDNVSFTDQYDPNSPLSVSDVVIAASLDGEDRLNFNSITNENQKTQYIELIKRGADSEVKSLFTRAANASENNARITSNFMNMEKFSSAETRMDRLRAYVATLEDGSELVIQKFSELTTNPETTAEEFAAMVNIANAENSDALIAGLADDSTRAINADQAVLLGLKGVRQDALFIRTETGYTIETGGSVTLADGNISSNRFSDIHIYDTDGSVMSNFWGDPHVVENGSHYGTHHPGGKASSFHFGDDSTFILPDGTEIKVDTALTRPDGVENTENIYYATGIVVRHEDTVLVAGRVTDSANTSEVFNQVTDFTGNDRFSEEHLVDAGADENGALVAVWSEQANGGEGGWAMRKADGKFYDIENEAWELEGENNDYKDNPSFTNQLGAEVAVEDAARWSSYDGIDAVRLQDRIQDREMKFIYANLVDQGSDEALRKAFFDLHDVSSFVDALNDNYDETLNLLQQVVNKGLDSELHEGFGLLAHNFVNGQLSDADQRKVDLILNDNVTGDEFNTYLEKSEGMSAISQEAYKTLLISNADEQTVNDFISISDNTALQAALEANEANVLETLAALSDKVNAGHKDELLEFFANNAASEVITSLIKDTHVDSVELLEYSERFAGLSPNTASVYAELLKDATNETFVNSFELIAGKNDRYGFEHALANNQEASLKLIQDLINKGIDFENNSEILEFAGDYATQIISGDEGFYGSLFPELLSSESVDAAELGQIVDLKKAQASRSETDKTRFRSAFEPGEPFNAQNQLKNRTAWDTAISGLADLYLGDAPQSIVDSYLTIVGRDIDNENIDNLDKSSVEKFTSLYNNRAGTAYANDIDYVLDLYSKLPKDSAFEASFDELTSRNKTKSAFENLKAVIDSEHSKIANEVFFSLVKLRGDLSANFVNNIMPGISADVLESLNDFLNIKNENGTGITDTQAENYLGFVEAGLSDAFLNIVNEMTKDGVSTNDDAYIYLTELADAADEDLELYGSIYNRLSAADNSVRESALHLAKDYILDDKPDTLKAFNNILHEDDIAFEDALAFVSNERNVELASRLNNPEHTMNFIKFASTTEDDAALSRYVSLVNQGVSETVLETFEILYSQNAAFQYHRAFEALSSNSGNINSLEALQDIVTGELNNNSKHHQTVQSLINIYQTTDNIDNKELPNNLYVGKQVREMKRNFDRIENTIINSNRVSEQTFDMLLVQLKELILNFESNNFPAMGANNQIIIELFKNGSESITDTFITTTINKQKSDYEIYSQFSDPSRNSSNRSVNDLFGNSSSRSSSGRSANNLFGNSSSRSSSGRSVNDLFGNSSSRSSSGRSVNNLFGNSSSRSSSGRSVNNLFGNSSSRSSSGRSVNNLFGNSSSRSVNKKNIQDFF